MTSQTPEETHNTREEIEEILYAPNLNITQGEYRTFIDEVVPKIVSTLLSQQQKYREAWLREEIVKLEVMKMANEHNSECLHNEAPEYCDCDNYIKWNKALQTIIDRYLLELKSIAQN